MQAATSVHITCNFLIFVVFLSACYATAQTERINVSGFVRDTGRVAMPQVTVQEKGTNNTTLTQVMVVFLSVRGLLNTGVFFIGYETRNSA